MCSVVRLLPLYVDVEFFDQETASSLIEFILFYCEVDIENGIFKKYFMFKREWSNSKMIPSDEET